jgi:hypothetical protein
MRRGVIGDDAFVLQPESLESAADLPLPYIVNSSNGEKLAMAEKVKRPGHVRLPRYRRRFRPA